MAHKNRPYGNIEDFLNLSSEDITKMPKEFLHGLVSKLNDAANKRMKRLEKSPLGVYSPSYQGRKGERFKTPKNGNKNAYRTAYQQARNFLNAKTSTVRGNTEHQRKWEKNYEKLRVYDKRYKNKKVITKKGKKKIAKFWDEYHKFQEANQRYGLIPTGSGGTNEDDVTYFLEEIYEEDMDLEEKINSLYKEKWMKEDPFEWEDNPPWEIVNPSEVEIPDGMGKGAGNAKKAKKGNNPLPTSKPKRKGKGKSSKGKSKGVDIAGKIKFESVQVIPRRKKSSK